MKKEVIRKIQDSIRDIFINNDLQLELENEKFDVKLKLEKKRLKLPQNTMLMQTFANYAAKNFNESQLKVIMFLFSISDYENFIDIKVNDICDELNLSKKTVVKVLDYFESNQIIYKFRDPYDHRKNFYLLSPLVCWKGNSFKRMIAINNIEKKEIELIRKKLLENEFENLHVQTAKEYLMNTKRHKKLLKKIENATSK